MLFCPIHTYLFLYLFIVIDDCVCMYALCAFVLGRECHGMFLAILVHVKRRVHVRCQVDVLRFATSANNAQRNMRADKEGKLSVSTPSSIRRGRRRRHDNFSTIGIRECLLMTVSAYCSTRMPIEPLEHLLSSEQLLI
jgi:hypothetical protein